MIIHHTSLSGPSLSELEQQTGVRKLCARFYRIVRIFFLPHWERVDQCISPFHFKWHQCKGWQSHPPTFKFKVHRSTLHTGNKSQVSLLRNIKTLWFWQQPHQECTVPEASRIMIGAMKLAQAITAHLFAEMGWEEMKWNEKYAIDAQTSVVLKNCKRLNSVLSQGDSYVSWWLFLLHTQTECYWRSFFSFHHKVMDWCWS